MVSTGIDTKNQSNEIPPQEFQDSLGSTKTRIFSKDRNEILSNNENKRIKDDIIYLRKELNTLKKMTTVTRTFDKDEKNHKQKQ